MTLTHSAPPIQDASPATPRSWWRSLVPRAWRQFQVTKSLQSPFWWLRTWHPWTGFALILLYWVWQHDRRIVHQVRLQRLFFQRVNFRDLNLMLSDFVRPELWIF